jgi:hypothetical protein
MNHKNFLIILIGAQLAATLINYGPFTNATLSAYFYYAIMSALLTVITAAFYLKQTIARPRGIYLLVTDLDRVRIDCGQCPPP